MFAATEHPLFTHRAGECSGVCDDGGSVRAPGPIFERVLQVATNGNIDHRREVQIEPEESKDFAGQGTVALNQPQVALFAQLLGAGGFRSTFL